MIVVDASVIVTALADDGHEGDRVRTRLSSDRLIAPHVIDLEVISAWRRLVRAGELDEARARRALDDLSSLDLRRAAHDPLVTRCWDLRHDLTAYDAAYVALAELFDVRLVTGDARLAAAPGPRCEIEVL